MRSRSSSEDQRQHRRLVAAAARQHSIGQAALGHQRVEIHPVAVRAAPPQRPLPLRQTGFSEGNRSRITPCEAHSREQEIPG